MRLFNRRKGADASRNRLKALADIVYSLDKSEAAMIPPLGDDDVPCTVEWCGERVDFMSRRAAILFFTNAFYGAKDPAEGERCLAIAQALRYGAKKASDGIAVKGKKPQATEAQVRLRDELRDEKRKFGELVSLMSLKGCEISRRRFAAKWQCAIDRLAELEENADFSMEDAQRQRRLSETLDKIKASGSGETADCVVFDSRLIKGK